MKNVLVLGGGKVGKSVAELLLICGRGEYKVTLADRDEGNLREAEGNIAALKTKLPAGMACEFVSKKADSGDKAAMRAMLTGQQYVVSMLPFDAARGIADLANEMGVHYFDVTEDVKNTDAVKAIDAAGKAKAALVPQCGLAPGYIAIAAYEVAKQFTALHDLTLRVGALPQFPTNALKYNVTWSTSGVVNEYCEPCNAMMEGKFVKVPALDGLEKFSFEGVEYEAFYTSGGVGSLVDTLIAEKRTSEETRLSYKTVRYPGHRDLMRFLLVDLRLGERNATPTKSGNKFDRAMAVDLLDYAVPRTLQDVVVVFISCIGVKNGRREQVNFKRAIPATTMFGRVWPAIELTTAAGVCAMVDLHRLGKLRATGFIRQEEVTLAMFNETIFGLAYENPGAIEGTVRG